MSGKFFLDTNIFVYEFDEGAPGKRTQASRLIRTAIQTGQGVISYQVVQEFFNVASKRFLKPLPVDEAENYLRAVFTPLLAVHSSPRLFLEALRLQTVHRQSWYDSLIVAGALEAGCETLYSEDFQTGRKFETVSVKNPFTTP